MEKLKAGDWVTVIGPTGLFVEQISNINVGYKSKATKWIPEIGTYQWFAKDNRSEPILAKLAGITYTNDSHTDISWYITDKYQDQWTGMGTVTTNMFKYCEPFIGELPSNLKEL